MIGRRLLTRMTRLGLSMYAAIWCMSFTVCAYDDPIADMAVSGRAALLTEAAGDAADAELVPGDEDPSGGAVLVDEPDVTGAEDPEDAGSVDAAAEGMTDPEGEEDIDGPFDDEVIEEVSEEDAASTLMSLPDSKLYFNVSNLTITDTSKSYKVSLIGTEALENIDPADTQYGFTGLSDSDKEGISVTLDEEKSFVISFNDKWNGGDNKLFKLEATYVYSDDYQFTGELDLSVYVPVTNIQMCAESGGEVLANSTDIEIGTTDQRYDASKDLTFTLSGSGDEQLNGSRISWSIFDPMRGISYAGDSDNEYFSIKDNPSNPKISKVLSFKDSFTEGSYTITASYNNGYVSAEGDDMDAGTAISTCDLNTKRFTVDEISISEDALTVNDINTVFNFTVNCSSGATIDPENLTYRISLTDTSIEETYTFYEGVNVTTLSNGTGQLSFNYQWNQSRCSHFYVVAIYTNSSGAKVYDSCKVAVYVPIKGIVFVKGDEIIGNEMDLGRVDRDENISLGMNITEDDWRIFLDPYRITWQLYNVTDSGLRFYTNVSRDFFSCRLSDSTLYATANLTYYLGDGKYALVPRCNNTYIDAEGNYVHAGDVTATCYFTVGTPIPEVEAHLSEKTLKVQIYNGKNDVPLTIRSSNVSENQYLHYSLRTVEIINEELDNYVDAFIEDDGKTINLRARSSVLALPAKELSALLKKKFSTGFIVSAVVDGNLVTLTTVDNITISFGNVKPTAKNIKVNGILEFDSYYQGEIKEITFIGGNVKELIPINATALGKLGFALIGGTRVQTTSGLPSTKKGSFKAIAILDDEENYNVPENYNITVTVNYVIKNSAPKFTSDISTIQLNPGTSDYQRINFKLEGSVDEATYLSYNLTDSKNNIVYDQLYLPIPDYEEGATEGSFEVHVTEATKPGQTYKLTLFAYNTRNGRRGAAKVFTVKTAASSNMNKKGLTLKAAGSIDASLPTQTLNITCTGKNVNLYGKGYPAITVKLKNGTNITGNFTCSFESATSKLMLGQNCQYSDFPLYEAGLAGQAIDINVAFSVSPTETVNATYSTKIGSSKVTPKLGITKASLNPDYVMPGVDGLFYGTRVNIPITNLPGGLYNYTVALDYGNLEEAPFTYEVFEGDYDVSDVVSVIPNTSALSSMLGKTCTVKITPNIPGNKGVAATCKITVLNPVKNKASVTAKATGKIDNIRDDSRVNLTISFKNVYLSESELAAIDLSQIMRVEGKKEINCTKYFTYAPSDDPCTIVLKRTPGSNYSPPAGTYKAYVSGVTFDSEWDTVRINTTVTFKVVRGKAGTTVKPSPVKMINRDYARTATINVSSKYADVNPIFDVKVVGAYADKMTIRDNLDGTYELEFNDTYVEGSIVKKIFTVISKFVTRTVQLEVYYQGSTVPDKVNAKVKINP